MMIIIFYFINRNFVFYICIFLNKHLFSSWWNAKHIQIYNWTDVIWNWRAFIFQKLYPTLVMLWYTEFHIMFCVHQQTHTHAYTTISTSSPPYQSIFLIIICSYECHIYICSTFYYIHQHIIECSSGGYVFF